MLNGLMNIGVVIFCANFKLKRANGRWRYESSKGFFPKSTH